MGVGLAICRVVEGHGARLEATFSVTAEGSTFSHSLAWASEA